MKTVILRTQKRTKSNSFGRTFSDADRGLFSKLTTKPTKLNKPTENKWILTFDLNLTKVYKKINIIVNNSAIIVHKLCK
jgi:hypothetical protein